MDGMDPVTLAALKQQMIKTLGATAVGLTADPDIFSQQLDRELSQAITAPLTGQDPDDAG